MKQNKESQIATNLQNVQYISNQQAPRIQTKFMNTSLGQFNTINSEFVHN